VSHRSFARSLLSLLSKLLQAKRDQTELFELGNHVLNDKATPTDLLELVATRGRIFETALRELIVEGQGAVEFAVDDPDQLVTAITSCLEGLSRFALRLRDQGQKRHPHPEILMRMLLDPQALGGRSKQ
jgi:hypothetical protein